jgi:phytoene synthase
MPSADVPAGAGSPRERLRAAESSENFPVALRVLPTAVRRRLRAVYDVVRTIDDLGDDPRRDPSGRARDLRAFAADLSAVWDPGAAPAAGVLRSLVPEVRAGGLPREPFERLVAANLQDQELTRYATWDELLGYCRLSADPIGRLVLAVFAVDVAPGSAVERDSDKVCTALQLLEHWQDVAEDHAQGRTYLPAGDMADFGVTEADLDARRASPALRRLVLHETDRAVALLDEGAGLVDALHGWARVAVAGYVAGGRAAADALRRSGGDVLTGSPSARKRDVARHLVRGLAPAPLPRRERNPMTIAGTTLGEAYTACETITRTEARNFYWGIRLLPPAKRSALCAVYALARRIDDIGDGDLPTSDKAIALTEVRTSLRSAADGSDPVVLAVHDAARRFPIPMGACDELVDGVEADVTMDARPDTSSPYYATFDDMVGYCRCVAGAVGRLCLGIFGSTPHPDASLYADQLGIALQQTNILRDIREDLTNGRVYLPREDLDRFGAELVLDEHGVLVDKTGGLAELITFSAQRARGWYADGLRLVPLLDRRSAACATAMAGIYRRLQDDIAADPPSVYSRRRSLSGAQKLGVAARSLAGRA